MGRRLPHTPKGRIVNTLRRLWLSSRERAAALKREGYCCERCGVKQSTAKGREVKVQVHHRDGIDNWGEVVAVIREKILCDPERLEVLCVSCHDKEHKEEE